MVKMKYLLPAVFIVLFLLMAIPAACFAAKDLVADLAGSFSDAQEAQLESSAAALGAQYNMDIVIVTTNDAAGKTAMAYADDYFDYNGYGVGENFDGILLLLDFDNREVWISTSGSGIQYLTDARINSILDEVTADGKMSGGDYFGAAQAFLTATADFLAAGIPHNSLTALDGILAAAAAGLTGISFFSATRGIYKAKPRRPVFEYQKNSFVNLGIVTDNLVNTYVNTRRIPRTTGTGGMGGSSTHTSSSGRTHGGGGRGF